MTGHSAGFGGEMRPRRRDPPPILFLFLTKRERAVDGPREKIAFGRAPVQWPSARTGVSRAGADQDCRPSAGSRRTAQLSLPCAACSVRRSSGWKIEWPLLLFPLPLHGPAKGLSNGRTHRSAPTEGKCPQRFCGGRPMCRPLSREGRPAAAEIEVICIRDFPGLR